MKEDKKVQNALKIAESLDLTKIRARVSKEHSNWDQERILMAEDYYRKFLSLCVAFPEQRLRPTRDIDEFWHAHILHTKQYHIDCQKLGMDYLHHEPL